ncbi:MAG TPA: response regulator [Chitinophagaceae bacterium]|nr:response regulator [Chitinophagaceae bacterium]
MQTNFRHNKKLVVLIVDDNMRFVERMISMLDDISHIDYVNVANEYQEACRSISSERPDLVLLDINLPGKNGIEILKKVKETNDQCRVIMLTNHADEYYKQLCKELGADFFLDKSHDFAKVPAIIRDMIARA